LNKRLFKILPIPVLFLLVTVWVLVHFLSQRGGGCHPAGWNLSDMAEAMPYRWERGSLYVLVWEVIDDEQRIYDRCLVLKQYDQPCERGETCALGYLRRIHEVGKSKWQAVRIIGRVARNGELLPPLFGFSMYQSLPTDEEIESFLKEQGWTGAFSVRWALGNGKEYHPKLLDGGLCRATWVQVFGREAPEKLFPELSKNESGK
jgi:hypothetical protein